MRVGIITEISYEICNYGNVCQAFALSDYITERYGHEVYTVGLKRHRESVTSLPLYCVKQIKRYLKKKRANIRMRALSQEKEQKFISFYNKHVPIKRFDDFGDVIDYGFDAFVVGSDVVWHQEHAFINSLKFLDLGEDYHPKKISYAASFGNEWIPRENENKIRKCLNNFDGVSVREKSTENFLSSLGVNNVCHVLDPVFLIEKGKWKDLASKPAIDDKILADYCFVYLLSPRKYEMEFLNRLLQKQRLKAVIVSYTDDAYDNITISDKCYLYNECSPQEWLWLIEHSKVILTDSFHGLAFSVIYGKDFFAMDRQKMMNRIEDFLNQMGLINMLISQDYTENDLDKTVDYANVDKKVIGLRNRSIKYLDDLLSSET